jgi:DNA-binding NarL/FixJ family response regulator
LILASLHFGFSSCDSRRNHSSNVPEHSIREFSGLDIASGCVKMCAPDHLIWFLQDRVIGFFTTTCVPGGGPMKCRILVADDHELVRRGLHAAFETRDDMCVCAEAVDGHDAIIKAHEAQPHVIILDAGMPRLNGISAARQILREMPRQRIILFSSVASEPIVRLALAAGIKGLVFKSDPLSDLIDAVNAVRQNRTFFSGPAGTVVLKGYLQNERGEAAEQASPQDYSLTMREIEVAQLLAEGKSSKEIAALLGLSSKTAETHRSNLMRKLHIHKLPGLVLYTIQKSIIEVPVFDPVSKVKTQIAAAA